MSLVSSWCCDVLVRLVTPEGKCTNELEIVPILESVLPIKRAFRPHPFCFVMGIYGWSEDGARRTSVLFYYYYYIPAGVGVTWLQSQHICLYLVVPQVVRNFPYNPVVQSVEAGHLGVYRWRRLMATGMGMFLGTRYNWSES